MAQKTGSSGSRLVDNWRNLDGLFLADEVAVVVGLDLPAPGLHTLPVQSPASVAVAVGLLLPMGRYAD